MVVFQPALYNSQNANRRYKVTSRERVLTALSGGVPDRVPYMEFGIDRSLLSRMLGWSTSTDAKTDLESNHFSPDEMTQVADHLDLDNSPYVMRAPVYAEKHAGKDGRLYYGEGLIRSTSDLSTISLPDPLDDSIYEQARTAVAKKGDRAACFVTRAGMFPALLGAGIERFSIALYDDRRFVEDLLDIYFEWSVAVAERACSMGFDFYVTTDDFAFKSAPYFSPAMFDEFMLPRYLELGRSFSLPWVMYSDGNILPFVESLLQIGITGLHPLEKGAVDIVSFKKTYGDRVCLLGNVDLNLLAAGTPDEVRNEVRWLLREVAPGGGYILTSGNSLASYCIPANVLAMTDEVKRSGAYPISLAAQ